MNHMPISAMSRYQQMTSANQYIDQAVTMTAAAITKPISSRTLEIRVSYNSSVSKTRFISYCLVRNYFASKKLSQRGKKNMIKVKKNNTQKADM